MIFSDFQLKSFVDPKPVELGESYTSLKYCPSLFVWLPKQNLKYPYTEKQYIQYPTLGVEPTPSEGGGIGYMVFQGTDTPNIICAIKQGGLEQTLEVYNSLLAQLA